MTIVDDARRVIAEVPEESDSIDADLSHLNEWGWQNVAKRLAEEVVAAAREAADLQAENEAFREALVWISDYPNRAHPDSVEDALELSTEAHEALLAAARGQAATEETT